MNEINVGEVYYQIGRQRSLDKAEQFLHGLETMPIETIGNSWPNVLEAARIKARFRISYADACAVATARRLDAVIVTGDREFASVGDLVEIHWLGRPTQ